VQGDVLGAVRVVLRDGGGEHEEGSPQEDFAGQTIRDLKLDVEDGCSEGDWVVSDYPIVFLTVPCNDSILMTISDQAGTPNCSQTFRWAATMQLPLSMTQSVSCFPPRVPRMVRSEAASPAATCPSSVSWVNNISKSPVSTFLCGPGTRFEVVNSRNRFRISVETARSSRGEMVIQASKVLFQTCVMRAELSQGDWK